MSDSPTLGHFKHAQMDIFAYLNLGSLFLFVFGLGMTMDFRPFKQQLRKPKGIIVGMLSHFIFQPFFSWLFAIVFKLEDDLALGLVIVGCCPGGMFSNLFVYIFRADLALNLAMTTASTCAALIFLPLNVGLYTPRFASTEVDIDFMTLVWTCMLVIIGVFLGIAVHHWNARVAKFGETILIPVSITITLVSNGLANSFSGSVFITLPFRYWLAAFSVGFCGIIFGVGVARMVGVSKPGSVAVGIETGLQNISLAVTIIDISFSGSTRGRVVSMPLMYGTISGVQALLFCIFAWKSGWTYLPKNLDWDAFFNAVKSMWQSGGPTESLALIRADSRRYLSMLDFTPSFAPNSRNTLGGSDAESFAPSAASERSDVESLGSFPTRTSPLKTP